MLQPSDATVRGIDVSPGRTSRGSTPGCGAVRRPATSITEPRERQETYRETVPDPAAGLDIGCDAMFGIWAGAMLGTALVMFLLFGDSLIEDVGAGTSMAVGGLVILLFLAHWI